MAVQQRLVHGRIVVGPSGAPLVDDDAPHPSGDDRYAIYVVHPNWTRASTVDHADGRKRLAETSAGGIGPCLLVLRDESQITDDSRVGILDRQTRRWIVNPWAKGDA